MIGFFKKIIRFIFISSLILTFSIGLGFLLYEYTLVEKYVPGKRSNFDLYPILIFSISLLYYSFVKKSYKLLISILIFVGIVSLLISYDVTSEDMEKYKWLIVLGCLPFVTIMFGDIFVVGADKNKQCAWCGGSKINFKSGKEGSWYWEFRNEDGSQDKRVKNNFQQASYSSEFECKKCNALTKFNHLVNKKPSSNIKIWKRALTVEGEGKREGTNWEDNYHLL